MFPYAIDKQEEIKKMEIIYPVKFAGKKISKSFDA